jgi:ATP-binding cassette subfamily C protein LapB
MLATRIHDTWAGACRTLGFARPAVAGSFMPLLLASIGINLLALALPIFILQVYDRVLPNQTVTTLVALIAGLSVALAFEIALRMLRAWLTTWNGARFEHAMRCRAVERLLRAPLRHFERDSAGTHLERVNAVGAMRDFHAGQLILALIDLPFALLFLSLIAYLGGWLVLVPIALLIVFGCLAMLIGNALRHSVAERSEADKHRYDFLIEALRGIHTVKALALNARLLRRQEALHETSALAVRRMMHQNTLAQTLGGLFSQLNLVVLVAAGALSVLDGRMTLGALAACTLLSGRALLPLQTAMGLWTSFQGVRIAQEQVAEVMATPDERRADAQTPEITGAIELRDIAFRHDADGPLLFDGLSLAAQPGDIVSIEGDTGSGKSTLLLLMQNLMTPQHGSVSIDGHDAAAIAPDWLRTHVALLPQKGAVYAGTVLENLTSFREGEVINQALTLAYLLGIDDAIKRLPEGFDTRIGIGEVLPAGLRQRIAIIRELVKQPRIILFDDADHALDADSSQRLVALLRQLGRKSTVILVSEKPQFLQIASRRYRLRNGTLYPVSPATGKVVIQEVVR